MLLFQQDLNRASEFELSPGMAVIVAIPKKQAVLINRYKGNSDLERSRLVDFAEMQIEVKLAQRMVRASGTLDCNRHV